jgi:hypothetical protein
MSWARRPDQASAGGRIVRLRTAMFISKYFKKSLAHSDFLILFNAFFLKMLRASYSNVRQRW